MVKNAVIRIGLAFALLGAITTFAFAQTPPRSHEMQFIWISELGTLKPASELAPDTASELTPDEPDKSTFVLLNNASVWDSSAPSFHDVVYCNPDGMTQTAMRASIRLTSWAMSRGVPPEGWSPRSLPRLDSGNTINTEHTSD